MTDRDSVTTHTPGPWRVSDMAIWGKSAWNAEVRLAQVSIFSPMNGIDAEANAHVLAAAPELLRSLQEISEMLMARPDMVAKLHPLMGLAEHEVFKRAEAAIAKATGQS